MEQRSLSLDHITVIGCIVRGPLFRGAGVVVGHNGIDRNALAGNDDAGLTCRPKGRGGPAPSQALGKSQGRVFLAERAVGPHRQDPLAAAFAAARSAIGPFTVPYIDQPHGAPRRGLYQLGERSQTCVQTAHDVEASICRRRQFGDPMRRKPAAGRCNADNDRTGPARGGLLRGNTLEAKSDAATRQAPLADHVLGTPIPDAERSLRRQFVLHVAEKKQIGLAQPMHDFSARRRYRWTALLRPALARLWLRRALSSSAPKYWRADATIDCGLMPSLAKPSSVHTLSTVNER